MYTRSSVLASWRRSAALGFTSRLECSGAGRGHLWRSSDLAGLLLGTALCRLALGSFLVFVSATYVQVQPGEVVVRAGDVMAALSIAFLATLGGALLPMMVAAGTSPLQSLDRYAAPRAILRPGVVGMELARSRLASLFHPCDFRVPGSRQDQILALAAIVLELIGTALLVPLLLRASGSCCALSIGGLGSGWEWLWEQMAGPIGERR